MTEQSEDTTPANTAEPAHEVKASAQAKKQPYWGITAGLTVLLLAALGAGAYALQKLQTALNANQQAVIRLNQNVEDLQSDARLDKFSSQVDERFTRNQQQLEALSQQLEALQQVQTITSAKADLTHDKVMADAYDWMLLEAAHLLRIAQHRLLLARDFKTARAALYAADQCLKDIDASGLIPIRDSINQQIQILANFPHPDYVALQLELDNLMHDLKSGLMAISAHSSVPESAAGIAEDPAATLEDELVTATQEFLLDMLNYIKSVFNDSVQVTRGEEQVSVFIEQQEQQRAYDFISLKFLAAKQAITSRDDDIYQQELAAALLWLDNNDGFSNKAKLITTIKQLMRAKLQPRLPDISPPEELLANYIATHGTSK